MRHVVGVLAFGLFATISATAQSNEIGFETVVSAEKLLGLRFSQEKVEMMLPGLRDQLRNFETLRTFPLSNGVPPALVFNPLPVGYQLPAGPRKKSRFASAGRIRLPEERDELAFYTVGQLAELLRTRQISSLELTEFFLARLKRFGPRLECVVNLTENRAREQARRADAEIAAGRYRGLLHGIPYGAKDLLATRGIPTTWGAAPFTNQVFDFDATVIRRLEEAGAVLVAKTTLGELAMGETWFGGMTRNPWNPNQGSSGSSAGSCAATAAGLLPFTIGSETLGSIVSPCDRCGVTGLRPTFGRVSRAGAMTLSWSMDKIGPICRSAEDCAIVFDTIRGKDPLDPSVYDVPFNYDSGLKVQKLRVGLLRTDFEQEKGVRKANAGAALERIRRMGMRLEPVQLPDYPVSSISFLLSTEGAAAFDDLTLQGTDDKLKQQDGGSWPNTFRKRRFVPAVEYLQAQRIRYLLIQDVARLFERVDVIIAPPFAGRSSLISNLTGHPCVVVPDGFSAESTPTSICFIGKLFGEAEILALAARYQSGTDYHHRRPEL